MPFLLIMSAPLLMAAEETSELNSGDTAWMLVASLLVLLMCLPGLALFYGGLVRGKNVLSIFVQCFAIAGVMSILWVIFGYAIATGDSWHGLIGWDSSKLFLDHISSTEDGNGPLSGTIPESVFVMFQMTFIIISPALIVGAFAERMKFCYLDFHYNLDVVILPTNVAYGLGWWAIAQLGCNRFCRRKCCAYQCRHCWSCSMHISGKKKGLSRSCAGATQCSFRAYRSSAAVGWLVWF